jgi:DNA-binding CsgD family transcriptional regulator
MNKRRVPLTTLVAEPSAARVPVSGPPPDLSAATCVIDGVEYVVLSHPLDVAPLLEPLSSAQQDIARGLLADLSYREIAVRRGTSPRTVAKQVEGIYRRLGVSSRAELVALLTRSELAVPSRREDPDVRS